MTVYISLCYHRVIPIEVAIKENIHPALYVTPKTFENHIKWMKNAGKIVSINDIKSNQKSKYCFLITFDDGWYDNYNYAYPILKKYNVPAIIFICTYHIEERKLLWTEKINILLSEIIKNNKKNAKKYIESIYDKIRKQYYIRTVNKSAHKNLNNMMYQIIDHIKMIPDKDREKYIFEIINDICKEVEIDESSYILKWENVIEMNKDIIEIGSHTHTHKLLHTASYDEIEYEVTTSKKIIENKLDTTITSLAYPNGYYDNNQIQKILESNKIKYAFTLEKKVFRSTCNNYLALPRYLVYENNSKSLSLYFLKESIKKIQKKTLLCKYHNLTHKIIRS